MKLTGFLVFFLVNGFCILGQRPQEGLWILKGSAEIIPDTVLDSNWYLPVYAFQCPDMIQYENGKFILIYGNIMDPNNPIIALNRSLFSEQGDCIFAWNPNNSMYEYVTTWVKDHFVYYSANGEGLEYEKLDPTILSQQQKELMVPKDDQILYWGSRLRPIEPYYRCNYTAKN